MTIAEPLLVSRMADGRPEIFCSIQGEGASIGTPSTFIRLAVCNLRCSWCDTAYTWDWRRYRREDQVLTLDVEAALAEVAAFPARNVVITGGEPLIQRRQLLALLTQLKRSGYRIEVETNGTIDPGELAAHVDQFNVSPKLASAGNAGLRTIVPAALAVFAAHHSSYLKFVVSSPGDIEEAAHLVAQLRFPNDRVILMPEGRTPAELAARSSWLADACIARGWRFSTRLHVLLWGDRRGV